MFKTYIRVLDKIVSVVIFVIFAIIFKVIFNFANVFTLKNPKIATGPLNSCDIVWIWVYPIEYLSRFLTKLLVKLRFGDFQIFLEFLHPFLDSKGHPKKSQIFEKSVVASDKFTFTVWGICSWQNCYLSLVWHICKYFWGNIQFLRCFRPKKHPKIITGPLNKCNILKTCLLPLQYIIKFSLKLLFKLCFGNFQILLGFCFTIFALQKPLKIITGLWKRCDVCQNYLSY